MSRKRIPTDEPLNITVARIETKQDLILGNQEVIQSTLVEQGKELAARPCRVHAKRISELVKSVNSLTINGTIETTRLQTVWMVVKITAGTLVGAAASIFGYLQTFKGG